MKLKLMFFSLAAGLALSPLCQAAKRECAEEKHESDTDYDAQPACPMQRPRVEPEAASSSAAASQMASVVPTINDDESNDEVASISAPATASFSRPTTSKNIASMLRARETTGRITTPFDSQKKLLAYRCKRLGNAIAAGADQEIKDELKCQINRLNYFYATTH